MHVSRVLGAGIEGIVFDAVGTLIDPDPPVAVAYRAAALRQGVEIGVDEVKARFRREFLREEGNEAGGPLETSEANERTRWQRIVGRVLPEVPDHDRAFAELWDHFGQASAWRCFDDVIPSITALAAFGYPIAVASNFDGRLRNILSGMEPFSERLETLVVSSEVGYRKPHPSFYAAVSTRLGLAPGRILYVGDDIPNDLDGSQRAGFRALLIDRKGSRPQGLAHVPDLHALVALVQSENSQRTGTGSRPGLGAEIA